MALPDRLKEAQLPDTLRCNVCSSANVAIAPGPFGFAATCRACGALTHLDDLLEPVALPATPTPVHIAA